MFAKTEPPSSIHDSSLFPGNLISSRVQIVCFYFHNIIAQVSRIVQDGRFLQVHTHGVRNGQHLSARLHSCLAFNDCVTAFGVVSELLNRASPDRVGLTPNFAFPRREATGWDQHACHLAKSGFDEAARLISVFPGAHFRLSIFKGRPVLWTTRPWNFPSASYLHHSTLTRASLVPNLLSV